MSDNWIVGNLQSAFETWNGKISEIWSLITTTPQAFHGGAAPYIHYPGLTFEQEDLSLPFDGLDNIEIIDEEDFHHEKDR